MFKSRLYLDFDGVVNADRLAFEDVKNFNVKVKKRGGYGHDTYSINYSPFVVSELDRFRKDYNVELVWLSTWNENLEVLRLPKHLNGLAGGRVLNCVLPYSSDITMREWTQWKADALLSDQLNDDTPFAWVDDEAVSLHKKNVAAATKLDMPKYFLDPEGWHGLRTLELKLLEKFFKSVA
jgi:hypothetical protein